MSTITDRQIEDLGLQHRCCVEVGDWATVRRIEWFGGGSVGGRHMQFARALIALAASTGADGRRDQIIADFLQRTGQYVTNDASREAAIKDAVDKALAARVDAPQPQGQQAVQWGDPGTVGTFIRQLQTFAPETPIHGAIHVSIDGKSLAMIKPLIMSRERVEGRYIRQGDATVPYSIVVWSAQDEKDGES